MKQVAPLRYDVIFKKAFGDKEIFTAFVRDLLGIKLEIDVVEKDKTYDSHVFVNNYQNRIGHFN